MPYPYANHRFTWVAFTRFLAVANLLLWLTFPAVGHCGTTSAPFSAPHAQINTEPPTITLNMHDVDIRALIQWIAEQTHKQIVIDPRVQGHVTAFADQPMSVAQAYLVFLSILETQGYSSSDIDGILRIYPSALAKTSPRAIVNNFDKAESSGQVMHIVAVKKVSAAAMAQLIKPLISPTGYLAALTGSDSLLIADSSDNVKRIAELVYQLDRTGSLDVSIIKLQHANAKDIAHVLTELVKPSSSNNSPATTGTEPQLSIAPDERSNSILLAGELPSRQRAQQLIQQLDQPVSASNASRVVFLHYLTAEDLLPILKSTTTTAQKEAKDQPTKDASISIEISKSNNAIVMTGPPDILDNMQAIIGKLDIQRSQVLVEALIVEVSNDVANDLGVTWNTSNLGDLKGSGGVAAVNTPGSLDPVVIDSNTGLPAGPAAGLTLGYYTGGNLKAAIRALSTHSKVNVLSTPSVMTIDNQPAQIMVGSNIPIIVGQSTGAAASTENPFTTYQRQDIGVTLKITPQINADKSVTLNILQEVQSVADTANTSFAGAKDIVTNKRSISTKVIVSNDRTVVLGGLISDQQQNSVSKVPILGDMPLVGGLFRSKSSKMTKQNLMVFIHPVVIDSDTTAEKVSRENYNGIQSQYDKYETNKLETTAQTPLPEFEKILPQRDSNQTPAPAN